MNVIIDIILAAVFAFTVIRFYTKGFVKALFSLCKFFLSIAAAFLLTPFVGNILNNKIIAFIVIFVLSMIACVFLSFTMDKIFNLPVLREINKLFGLALGVVCGFLYAMVSVTVITWILDLLSLNNPEISAEIMSEKTVIYSVLSKIDIISILFVH